VKFLFDHAVPDDLSYLLKQLGHEVSLLREVLPHDTADAVVFQFAQDHECLPVTCNRDDFLELVKQKEHHGIVILVRRRTRAAERAALFRLFQRAGQAGLKNNINFA
jgi:predicted nuclease of predicted toxin-antitoxin system